MARTEAEMKEILADKLYVGKKVRVERFNTPIGKGNGNVESVTMRGRVEGLYPHVFTVRFGEGWKHSNTVRYLSGKEAG